MHLSLCRFPLTHLQMCTATQGIKKLRALRAEEKKETVLWRGMRSLKVTADFMRQVRG